MTGPQRTRLVLALGALNIVLATFAFGLAGSLDTEDQVARATATPSLSAPPIAGGSPAPSTGPGATQPPVTTPTEAPGESPEASAPPASATPGSGTTGPVAVAATPAPVANAVASAAPPAAPPVATPAAPPPTAAPPTAAPVVVPSPPPSKATPPCPGTVTGAPGLSKGSGDPTRPCKGGDGDDKGGSGDDRGRGDEQARSRANPCRGRRRREVA